MPRQQFPNMSFALRGGSRIPAIGFGTWKSTPDDAYESVKSALQAGYRHIDTAFVSLAARLQFPQAGVPRANPNSPVSIGETIVLTVSYQPRTTATKPMSGGPSETAACPEKTYS